ncbi:MAG TPA: hypothetical protein VMV59_04315, partial [Candidatus Dormibacteraeota bacterium]|nr:hypothetical protein [Candidatus Dormibacteraeota bacterium]
MTENTSTFHFLIANENQLTSPPFTTAVPNGLGREARTTMPTKMDWGAKRFFLRAGARSLDASEALRYRPQIKFERRSLLRGRLDGRKISTGLCREAQRQD